ncbi:putative phage tail protein [Acidocella sp.]|uniref:putative phage tail protein n=1 Tax=Acidocella sp. TaxID=50710 RepID=UPI00262657F0|nr:putative phage tail protein [Acidocella sp.]
MSRSVQQVLAELLAISPPGTTLPADMPVVWSLSPLGFMLPRDATGWAVWLTPLAVEISIFEMLLDEMLAEVDPGTAQYLLTDYERVLGPDPYGRDAGTLTIGQRQVLAHSRWTGRYGARPVDFVALAADFGVTITVTEFEALETDFFAGAECSDHPIDFTWQVNLPAAAMEYAFANEFSAGDLVSSFTPSNVQGVIEAHNPAQMTVIFNYA